MIIESFVLVSHRTVLTNANSKTDMIIKNIAEVEASLSYADQPGLPNEIFFQLSKDIYYKTMPPTFHVVKGALGIAFPNKSFRKFHYAKVRF